MTYIMVFWYVLCQTFRSSNLCPDLGETNLSDMMTCAKELDSSNKVVEELIACMWPGSDSVFVPGTWSMLAVPSLLQEKITQVFFLF